MKKILCLLTAVLLLIALPCGVWVSAAGTASITTNKSTVTIGSTVTITAKYNGGGKGIGSLDARFSYNAKSFKYVSCNGATANGGAGTVQMSYFSMEATPPQNLTISITLKAIAAGSGDFKWETTGMYDDNDTLLGTPKGSPSVTASNPSLSGDATLSYLRPTKGTLVPKFDKNVTQYTVSVPYTVTRGLLNFTASDPNAQTQVTENADLKVGKTTRVITVTAPNGTTKKYTVVFTREAEQNTTTGSDTTTTTPVMQTPQVEVNGELLDVAINQPPINPPAGFVWDYITLNNQDVAAAKQENGSLVLLYLTAPDAESGSLYLFDAAEDTFTLFRQVTTAGATYVLHELPDSEVSPLGTVAGTVTIGEQEVSAYVYEDPALADYALVQLTGPDGVSGLYTYDKVQVTFQRYHTVTVEKEVILDPEPQVENNPVLAFVETYQRVILLGAAAIAALALLLVVIIWIASRSVGSKGKH